ncbi:Mpo1-like protein [Hydrocarboniphaga effusa]|jgi:hypothetical protein|uniref:Mpo1-like protein n=1 Tax=Hydrocarboniphaga effusa TaxID=243629 RepID=UPI00398BD604
MPDVRTDARLEPLQFSSVAEFYPFYLSQHRSYVNRRLHFIGTTGLLVALMAALISHEGRWLVAVPLSGYGFAWIGHFVFEKNRPATFRYPLYSFVCDFLMYRDMLLQRPL